MRSFVFFICLFISVASQAADPESIAVSIGRSVSWPIGAREAVTVSNGAVVRVVDQGAALKITGVKLGQAVVKAGGRSLEVSVLPEASYRSYELLKESVEGRRGLRLDVRAGQLEVRGRLLRWSDWRDVSLAMKNATGDTFHFAADVDPSVRDVVLAKLREHVRRAGFAEPDFRFEPEATAIVPADPKEMKDRFERVLAPFGIRVEASTAVVDLAPMVRVKIVVAEVKRDHESLIGPKWDTSVHAQVLPDWAFPTGKPFEVELNALEHKGLAKVLASPTLLCRSGKEAEFLAGGEMPIKVATLKQHDVIWKQYGVVLRIKPVADFSGRMSIEITSEVSAPTGPTVDGVPGLSTNRIQTHFDLASSRTIALSGLIKKDWSEDHEGLAGLSALPILGPLFSSRDFKEHESELVVFVTPELQRHEDVN